MKYILVEEYFSSALFQNTVIHYFNTVLAKIIQENTLLDAKGKFVVKGELKRDYYDMPYHTHILSGLIPSLFIYEQFMISNGSIELKEAEIYLKVFILGYTFHDSNKLFDTKDLETAIEALEKRIYHYDVLAFFPEFEKYKTNVYFLNLSDENRTSIIANKYRITLNPRHIKEHLGLLCKFADGLASSQNLESVESFYKDVARCLKQLEKATPLVNMPVSYIQLRENPYTLLSQRVLQSARKVLARHDKEVVFTTRDGLIYFGEEIGKAEYQEILSLFQDRGASIKHLELTKVDAQKCTFDFIGTKEFNQEILEDIIDNLKDKFLALSPNGSEKITNYEGFIDFTTQFIQAYHLPILIKNQEGKLYLNFVETISEERLEAFVTIFCLNKIKWLNSKTSKLWKQDLNGWIKKDRPLPISFSFSQDETKHEFKTTFAIIDYIKLNTKSASHLLKTYLNFIKSYIPLVEYDDEELEEYIEKLKEEALSTFESKSKTNNTAQLFFEKYFSFRGELGIEFLSHYEPSIPEKNKMCAFTGGIGLVPYKEGVAFGMKARGFSSRTLSTLRNNTSHISELFAEENKLRKSNAAFPNDANLVVYIDFFESQLGINRDILAACVQAKNIANYLENNDYVVFNKNAKFQYNLDNLEFTKLSPGIEPAFYLIRKYLLMIKTLGLRAYITGIMSPYIAHKEVFRFENAPRFARQLGWHSVRLSEVEQVLEEIKLVLLFGKKKVEGNILKIATTRRAYFRLYNELKPTDKKKVFDKLMTFINNNQNKFRGMTTIQKLVNIAVQIEQDASSGAKETWLIRTALDFIRTNFKEGLGKEDTIEQIAGAIYRKLRLSGGETTIIEHFARAVYEELFEKQWKGKILNLNREKDWIYQFAFVFQKTHQERLDQNTARKIKRELEEKKLPITLKNIANHIGKKREKYAPKYLRILQDKT